MGERQPERTRYTLLPDPTQPFAKGWGERSGGTYTFLFRYFTILGIISNKTKFFQSRDRGRRGIKGVNVPWSYLSLSSTSTFLNEFR